MTTEIALKSRFYYPIGYSAQYKPLFAYASKYELIDRLYRRYVRKGDIEATKELVEKIFDDISFDKDTRNVFIEAYNDCLHDVEDYTDRYRPIRIINIEGDNVILYQAMETDLPLEEYDNLGGDPFWMDPLYMEKRYEAHQTPKTYDMTNEGTLYFIRHIDEFLFPFSSDYPVAVLLTNAKEHEKDVCGIMNEILSKPEHLKYIKENRKKITKKKLLQSLMRAESSNLMPELITAIERLKEALNEDGWLYKRCR